MVSPRSIVRKLKAMCSTMLAMLFDAWRFLVLCLCPAPALAAEILYLRKQLTLYEERQVKPARATNAIRLPMVWLSHWFDWRSALRIVTPETFTRWHRQGFRLLWRWKSTPGRPALPKNVQALIRRMALENPTWGQERIGQEAMPADHPYRIVIHDRDAIFSTHVDQGVRNLGLHVLKTPVRTPVANAICERVIGTIRRDCLDFSFR